MRTHRAETQSRKFAEIAKAALTTARRAWFRSCSLIGQAGFNDFSALSASRRLCVSALDHQNRSSGLTVVTELVPDACRLPGLARPLSSGREDDPVRTDIPTGRLAAGTA